MFISEMCDLLFSHFHVAYSQQQIHRRLVNQHGWTRKKVELRAMEQDEELRAQYQYMVRPQRLGGVFSALHLVFLDESHSKMKAWLREFGTSPRGEKIEIPSAFRWANDSNSAIGVLAVEGL